MVVEMVRGTNITASKLPARGPPLNYSTMGFERGATNKFIGLCDHGRWLNFHLLSVCIVMQSTDEINHLKVGMVPISHNNPLDQPLYV